jgi:hypothetical protein
MTAETEVNGVYLYLKWKMRDNHPHDINVVSPNNIFPLLSADIKTQLESDMKKICEEIK